MKTLWLMRHAYAENATSSDADRPLSNYGREQMQGVGDWFVANNAIFPDMVLCSNSRRTSESWDIMSAKLPNKIPVSYEPGLYLASSGEILRYISDNDDDINNILLISHNIGLHQCAMMIISGGDNKLIRNLGAGFPPGSIAKYQLDADSWQEITSKGAKLIDLRLGGAEEKIS